MPDETTTVTTEPENREPESYEPENRELESNETKDKKPDNGRKQERLLSKDYILLIATSLCTNLLNYSFLATIAPFMVLLTGKAVYGGVITSVNSITAIAARPMAGIISDRSGRVKLMIAGAIVCAIASFGFSLTTALLLLIALRAIMGIGFGIHSTCAGASIADVVPKSRLAEGVGYYGLYSVAGQMIAPAIALAITAGGRLSDYNNLFIILIFVCVASALTGCGVTYERKMKKSGVEIRDARLQKTGDSVNPDKVLPKTFFGFEYAVFAPCAVIALVLFSYTSVLSFVTLLAASKNFGNSGLFFTFSALGVLASRLTTGRIVDKRGADIIVVPALGVMVALFVLIPHAPSMTVLTALAVPIGFAQSSVMPTLNAMMFQRCSPERRGTASAAFLSTIDLGIAVGSPILGMIVDAAGYTTMYLVAAVVCFASLAVYLLFASDKRYNARKAQEETT